MRCKRCRKMQESTTIHRLQAHQNNSKHVDQPFHDVIMMFVSTSSQLSSLAPVSLVWLCIFSERVFFAKDGLRRRAIHQDMHQAWPGIFVQQNSVGNSPEGCHWEAVFWISAANIFRKNERIVCRHLCSKLIAGKLCHLRTHRHLSC